MKSSEYWKERFSELEEIQNAKGVAYTQDVINGYNLALKELEEKIAVWYQRFADNNGISMAKARKLLTSKELKEFKWDVFEYIKHGEENALTGEWIKELENASARFHISRLEALKVQTRQVFEKLYANQLSDVTNMVSEVYEDGYYRSMFEMQKGFNIGFSVARLDETKLQKVISAPWAPDGKNFSSRIWENKQKLISELQTELTRGVILGSDPQKIINSLSKKLETSKSVTGRLVMTEQAALSARAQKECFEELDVEEFEVVETLDFKTCQQCGDMDGKHFPMSEYVIGTTVPPFHPRCRGCVCPYFDDEFDLAGQRIAKDSEGGTFYVSGDTTYKQWQQMQEEKYGAGIVARTQKMVYNKNADIEQYERYKSILKENAPKNLSEFLAIKYNDSVTWEKLKYQYRTVNQYKIDSGNVSVQDILELDRKLISEKRNNFPSKYKKSGNIAGAYIDSEEEMYIAHSRINYEADAGFKNYKGTSHIALLNAERNFDYIDVDTPDGTLRKDTHFDTEAKLFEHFHVLSKTKNFNTITMISERGMCDSCKGVMEQFKAAHPDIEVNVVSNKKVNSNVWKYRKGKRHEKS